jgi:hypothetical protein
MSLLPSITDYPMIRKPEKKRHTTTANRYNGVDAPDVDDPTAIPIGIERLLLQHLSSSVLDSKKCSTRVDVHDSIEAFLLEVMRGPILALNTCVVHHTF